MGLHFGPVRDWGTEVVTEMFGTCCLFLLLAAHYWSVIPTTGARWGVRHELHPRGVYVPDASNLGALAGFLPRDSAN